MLEMLWVRDQTKWEPIIVDFGAEAEKMVVLHLGDEDRALARSAVTILKRVGTVASVPALQRALEQITNDDEMKVLIQSAIESLQAG
jgi:hypothetical protein